MKKYCVYKHIIPNNKVYIGITSISPESRWKNGNGYKNQMFYRAIQKYGWNNIRHEILFEELTKEEAEQKEIELIKQYNSTNGKFGYNIDNGGSSIGCHSEVTRQKFSKNMLGDTRNKGRTHTVESRKHMSEAHLGYKVKEETKKKLSIIRTGKTNSDEVIKNMTKAARKSKSYPVYCVELNMTFYSVPEAVEYIKSINGSVIRQGIQKAIKGEINTSGKLNDGTKLHWLKVGGDYIGRKK